MAEDARHGAVVQILGEEGASSPNMDSDTLATRILKAVDENTASAGGQPEGDEAKPVEGTSSPAEGDGANDQTTGAGT